MKLPNWFKVVWWILLTALLTTFLLVRRPDLVSGRATAADVVVFIVWMALLLMPLFNEVEILGFKFKQEIEKLKQDIKAELHLVKAEVRNAIDVSPTINLAPAPSPESALPDLEERIKAAVARELAEHRVSPPDAQHFQISPPPEEVQRLFAIRYRLEQELKFLAFATGVEPRKVGPWPLAKALAEANVLDNELFEAIREIFAITSAAVHGDRPSPARVAFVRDVAPQIIQSLKTLVNER